MTCEEVQAYLDESKGEQEIYHLAAEAMQHVSKCDSCQRFVEKRKEMLATLRLLRETAPTVTSSVDHAVLTGYRDRMAMCQRTPTRSEHSLTAPWRSGLTVAAAMMILAAIALERRPSNPARPVSQVPRPVEVAQRVSPEPREIVHRVAHRKYVAKATVRELDTAVSKSVPAVGQPMQQDDSQEFRSLMYCDELSCDGGMNVVRVQLPALPSGFLSANTGPRPVSADVLVGADGFARGIRIVH